MKTTKKHFELFKKEVLRLLDVFKISGWETHFKIDKKDKENLSGLKTDLVGRQAKFILNEEWRYNDLNNEEIKKTALHEVLHLVFVRLHILAITRFVSSDEVEEAGEEAVNVLMGYILKK